MSVQVCQGEGPISSKGAERFMVVSCNRKIEISKPIMTMLAKRAYCQFIFRCKTEILSCIVRVWTDICLLSSIV